MIAKIVYEILIVVEKTKERPIFNISVSTALFLSRAYLFPFPSRNAANFEILSEKIYFGLGLSPALA